MRLLRRLRFLTDVLLPRYCAGCDKRMTVEEDYLCLSCMVKLPRTYLWRNPKSNALAKRYWGRTGDVEAEKVVAWLTYAQGTIVGHIVHSMKYYGDKPLARYMGYLMAQELRETEFFDDIDFLLPVPLTRWRKLKRGYNQAEEIARGIEQVTGTEVRNDILKRVKFSGSQTRLTEEDRMTNVEQAFRLRIKDPETLKGKHILIIDDVITSSATTRACAKQLAQIPEVRVSILALATPQTESLRIENIKVHNEESIKNIDNGDHRSSDALSM